MSTSETRDEKERDHKPEPDRAPSSTGDPLGPVLDSFLRRFRKGERPSLTEYIGRYPSLADEIRELLPALVEIEQLGSVEGAAAQVGARGKSGGPAHGAADVTELLDPSAKPISTASESTAPWPTRLGDYRILRCIGEGGMGVVYEAVRESLHSHVALKVMHPRFRASAGYLRRFHNEARSAAQLHHTNIVSVFDFGEHEGVCYYAMQYIAGHSLDEILADVRRLRQNPRQAGVAPVGTGRNAKPQGDPARLEAVQSTAEPAATTDPLLRTVIQGLMTGHFDPATRDVSGIEECKPEITESIQSANRSATSLTHEISVEPGQAPETTSPSTKGDDRNQPSSASGLSSSSLACHGEDRYHREVARLCAQVADALAYAHQRGVLHRDIKPLNLLLDAVGNVWVTDFGLAKFEESEDLSQSCDVIGTLRYMSPERFRGVSDRRCDIYALGATLYELLTLRPVFESADRPRLISQVMHETPIPPRQVDPGISRDLETIVLKALAKDPKDRFATAAELSAELRRFLEHRPIRSRPISAAERLWRWCKRNAAVAALIALVATLTVLIAIGSIVAAWKYRGQSNALRAEQGVTKATLSRAEHAEHESRLAFGQSLVSEGAALQRSGLIGQRFDSLDRLGKAAQVLRADSEGRKRLPEIRNHAIAALGLTDLRVRTQVDRGLFGTDVDAAVERFADIDHSGEVVVRHLDDGHELARLPGPDRSDFGYPFPVFSPDGSLLIAAYGQSGDLLLRIWHLERRELLCSLSSRSGPLFHPDGRRLLFGAPEGGITVWDLVERRVVRRLPLDFTPYIFVADPDGARLAVNNDDQKKPRVAILDLETGRVLHDWRLQVGNGAMAWSADGQLLAVGNHGDDSRVYVWNVRRGTLASVLQGHTGDIIGAHFAHSGYLLATSSWDSTTRLWDAAAGEPLVTATGELRGSFAPDDCRLPFILAGKIGVWDLDVGSECRTLHPGMRGNRSEMREIANKIAADVSFDGRLVATADGNGFRLWDSDTGRELAQFDTGLCDTVLFHADGQKLISSGERGLYRWPIRSDPDRGPDAIRVGPPELLRETAESRTGKEATWLPDHRTLALIDNANARVVLVDSSHPHPPWSRAKAFDSGENRRMNSVAVSPDGRWLAVGGWKERGVRVWDLRRRRLECILRPNELGGDMTFYVAFSSDGLRLVSSTSSDVKTAYHFWTVGTWEPGLLIDPDRKVGIYQPPTFTGDGRLMALGIASDQVLLADAATGRELARLTTSQPVSPIPLLFSPDGTKLIARTNQKTVLVWDLRRIRDQLRPMGLDWDAPSYPAASAAIVAPGPVQPPRSVRVVGEIVETEARRAAERTEMNRRLAAQPDDAEALIHRGWLFTQQRKWPEAVADLERGSRLRPDDADALFLLAEALAATNTLPAARATLEKYLARSSDDLEARIKKGQMALQLGRLQEAVDDFTKALDADPGRNPIRYRRAQIWLRMGRFQEALADLNLLIEQHPRDPALYELRSQAHDRLGHREQAQADMKQAVESPPAGAQQYNNLAWRLATGPLALRDPERALVLARKAVELTPGAAIYLNTLGVALYRTGRYAEAISNLEKSLAASKGKSDAFDLYFLAMARHSLGQIARARADFELAVRWQRDHPNLAQPGWSDELDLFRAEAEEVLAGARAELPADLFAPE